jgi:DNA mismatch repair ATPase MutS
MRVEGHLYDRDLNLLGEQSLFGLLDTVRTGIGQRGLAEYLLHPVAHQESLDRQAAVRELASHTALREQIAVLGASKFQQVQARFFDEWLDQDLPVFSPVWRPVLAVTAAALTAGLALGLTHVVAWSILWQPLALVAVLQAGIVAFLGARVKPILDATARLSNHVQMFSEGLAVLERQSFVSEKLQQVQAAAREPANAVPQLAKLQSQITLVQQRTKELFYVFSALTAAGTQAGIAIAAWKRRNAAAMRGWMAAWAEFEALNALANYAFEHPEDVWPELLPEGIARFDATSLGHPLLAACVRNDVSLSASPETAARFFLISGSNMSGKSTLLRSIGINAVLAYAGAPVRARSMRLTPLRLGAALALTDSLAEGKSKFLAEVERLARIVETSSAAPVLFLVDEIFSGTNSADRRAAAGAVLRSLLHNGAIGALSTHDLALAELATPDNGGLNVHMASPDPDDPLGFDYKLKSGVNTSSNALAIIRMMGLDA